MLEVALVVLLAWLFYGVFFYIFPIWELKTAFFHSVVGHLSQTQEVSNLSMKTGHLQVVLSTVTTQLSNGCHLATRSQAGAGVEKGGSVKIHYLKGCVLSTQWVWNVVDLDRGVQAPEAQPGLGGS